MCINLKYSYIPCTVSRKLTHINTNSKSAPPTSLIILNAKLWQSEKLLKSLLSKFIGAEKENKKRIDFSVCKLLKVISLMVELAADQWGVFGGEEMRLGEKKSWNLLTRKYEKRLLLKFMTAKNDQMVEVIRLFWLCEIKRPLRWKSFQKTCV